MASEKIYWHKRLTSKFLGIAFILSMLPLIFIYNYSINNATDMLTTSLRNDLKEKSFLVGADIDRYFEQRKHDVKILSQADVLEGESIEKIIQYLTEVIKETPYLDDIDVINPEGIVIASSGQQNEKGKHVLELYPQLNTLFSESQNANQGDLYVSNILELDNGPGLAFLTPITDDSNSVVIKTLLVEINLDTVKAIVAEFNERVIGNKFVYLVDNDGRVIVTADPSVKLLELFPDLFVNRDLLHKFSEQGEVGSIIYTDSHNEKVMAGFADMAEFGINKAMDWSIISVAPISDIIQPVQKFKDTLLLITLITFTIATLLLYITSHHILKAVNNVVDGARKVSSGDHNSRIELTGDDEFTFLGESINHTLDHLVKAELEAQAATKTKAKFLAAMSHEIRTPLAGIMGMAELLNNSDLTSEQINWSKNITKSSDNLMFLLNEILDQSKLEAKQMSIEKQDINLHLILKDTFNLYIPKMATKDIVASIEINSDVPISIHADPTRISQVVSNLLTNAIKFTAKGQIVLKVSMLSVSRDTKLVGKCDDTLKECDTNDTIRPMLYISIIDTGIGLDIDTQKKLFKPFSQADSSTSRVYGGTGLGLSISKQLVQLMGGEIGVQSIADLGSKFWFTLPYEKNHNPLIDSSKQVPLGGWVSLQPLKILVAEDTPVLQRIILTHLTKLNHEVEIVENGKKAVEKIKSQNFDLILMDIRMPEMDGMEATRIIRALTSDKSKVKIIALTADISAGNVDEYLKSGINDVCAKPVDLKELLPAINRQLNKVIHKQTDITQDESSSI